MLIHSRSHLLQATFVGIVTIVALSVGSVCSRPAADSRRLLGETGHAGSQLNLVHWSHHESPFHVADVSGTEKLKYAVERSKNRLSSMSGSSYSSNVTFISPLSSIQGEYVMELSLGTPPQNFTAIADTGSDLVWVKCSPCSSGCDPQPDLLYDPTKSTTYKAASCKDPFCQPVEMSCTDDTCQYQYGYGSGLTIGNLAYETITVNTTAAHTEISPDFVFGCAQGDGGFDGVDGLVGLGKGPLSFTSQLGSYYGNKFSYCLVSFNDNSNQTSPLLFGNDAVPTLPIQYTPIVTNPNQTFYGSETFYYIGLTGIEVNGVALNIPNDTFSFDPTGLGGVISDCGTEISQIVDVAYEALLESLKSQISYTAAPFTNLTIGLDLCYSPSGIENLTFPNVTLVFDGMRLDLPQENVFVVIPGTDNFICLAIGSSGPPPTVSIFGNIQQQNFQVLHDLENSRYGFAKTDCTSD